MIVNHQLVYRVTSSSGNTWQFDNFDDAENFVDRQSTGNYAYRIDELEVILTPKRVWGRRKEDHDITEYTDVNRVIAAKGA